MSLKRKYIITLSLAGVEKMHSQEAECMKTVDGNVVLMNWDEAGCRFNEVGFFKDPVRVVSVAL